MELFNYWVYGVAIMVAAMAIRDVSGDVRTSAIIAFVWPVSVTFMACVLSLWAIGWDFDIDGTKNDKWFGFRRPNDGWPGFAVTILKLEFQFWKKR